MRRALTRLFHFRVPSVALRLGVGAAVLSAAVRSESAPYGDDDGPADVDGARRRVANPGDFSNREHELSLGVDPAEGLSLVLQSSIGGPGPGGGAVVLQMQLAAQGAQSFLVVTDSREPSLQLVFAPGHEGRTAKLVIGAKPLEGVTVEGEVLATVAGALSHAKGSTKIASNDASFSAAYTVPFGSGAPSHAELAYHQAVTERSTAGVSLTAVVAPDSWRVASLPQWGVFGSLSSAQGDSALLGKFSLSPRQDGQTARSLSVIAWHRATRSLELSTSFALALGTPEDAPPRTIRPIDSSCGIGARMTFEGGGGLNPVLGAHVSGRTAGVSFQVPFAGFGSNTFLRTTTSVVSDHSAKDYKVGANVEMYY
jgi:hypothetical protein